MILYHIIKNRYFGRLLLAYLLCAPSISICQEINSSFANYMHLIDSSLRLNEVEYPRAAFPFLSTSASRQITWTPQGDLAIGIAYDFLHRQLDHSLQDYDLLVYSHRYKKLIIFLHRNEEVDSCRPVVSLFDIAAHIHHCYVFDNSLNCVGSFSSQFNLKGNKTYFESFKKVSGKRFVLGKFLPEADEYNGKSYLFIYFSDFAKFVDMIFSASCETDKDSLTWREDTGRNVIVEFVERNAAKKK
jgi:hypothetical protein